MSYRYETHLHTCLASACGISTGAEHARFYHAMGYRGIIVTDHFFGGNTCVPRYLPWKEKIDLYCAGYEDALAEGRKLGLEVFFGWEQGYGDDEYLVYGLDKQWLYDHPEIEKCSRARQLEMVHADGGCVIQAHPFRDRAYVQHVRLGLQYCDGIEAVNAANNPMNDACALRYAKEYNLLITAGSDNHNSERTAENPDLYLAGIELDEPIRDMKEYAAMIRAHRQPGVFFNKERLRIPADQVYHIESNWMDSRGNPLPTHRDWYEEFPDFEI